MFLASEIMYADVKRVVRIKEIGRRNSVSVVLTELSLEVCMLIMQHSSDDKNIYQLCQIRSCIDLRVSVGLFPSSV
jgi:hypothetical protein